MEETSVCMSDTHAYTHTHTHTHIHTHAYTHTHTRARTRTHAYTQVLGIEAKNRTGSDNFVTSMRAEVRRRRRGGGCLVVQRRWRSWEESGGSVAMVTMQSLLPSQLLIGQLEELYTCHKTLFSRLPSELLYGHTGYLYALLFVNSYIPGAVPDSTLEEVRGERDGVWKGGRGWSEEGREGWSEEGGREGWRKEGRE